MKKAIVLFALLAFTILAMAGMELTSARVYRKQGDLVKALNFYNQALQKEPANLEALEERGEICHAIALDSSKVELAKQITNNDPNPQEVLLNRSLADFSKAVVSQNPKEEGIVKKNKKKIDEILQNTWNHFYFLAVIQDSLNKQAVEKGDKETARGFLIAGLKDLDNAVRVLPEKWNAYGFRAQMYTRLDSTEASARNWAQAIEKIKGADKSKQESEEYKTGLAIAKEALLFDYYNLGNTHRVLELSDDILKSEPTNINAIQLKANTLARMTTDTTLTKATRDSLKNVAITALQSAETATLSGTTVDSVAVGDMKYTIGQFKMQLADTAGAISAFSDVLKYNPKDKDVAFVLGVIYLEGGTFTDNKKAKQLFESITVQFPDEGKAWINYGIALIREGDNAKGKTAIETGNKLLKDK